MHKIHSSDDTGRAAHVTQIRPNSVTLERKLTTAPTVIGEQRTHRTLLLKVSPEFEQESTRSWIGHTKKEYWSDSLQEVLHMARWNQIRVRGITTTRFILSFMTTDDMKNMDKGLLQEWFYEIKNWNNIDLIQPRTAWVHCEGLPISAWTDENLKKIFEDWGKVISSSHVPMVCNMYQTNMVAVSTFKVFKIEETINVMIQNVGYWLKIREATTYVDSKSLIHDNNDGNQNTTRDNISEEEIQAEDYSEHTVEDQAERATRLDMIVEEEIEVVNNINRVGEEEWNDNHDITPSAVPSQDIEIVEQGQLECDSNQRTSGHQLENQVQA